MYTAIIQNTVSFPMELPLSSSPEMRQKCTQNNYSNVTAKAVVLIILYMPDKMYIYLYI